MTIWLMGDWMGLSFCVWISTFMLPHLPCFSSYLTTTTFL